MELIAMNDWFDDALDDDLPEGALSGAPDDGLVLESYTLEAFDEEEAAALMADEPPADEAPAASEDNAALTGRDLESIFAAAAAAVAAASLTRGEELAEPLLHAEPLPVAPVPAAPPGVAIPVRDRLLTFLSLPVFDEFANLATNYGELLRIRYNEVRLPADLQELVARFPDTLHLVAVVTEGDPDTAAVLPIVARLVDASVRLDMRIVEDEDEASLRPLALLLPDLDMAAALEEWDLPQIFVFDEEWEVQAQWGPRPTAADAGVETWLAANPNYELLAGDESPAAVAAHTALTHTLLYEMRVWYNSGLTAACLAEWRDLLASLLPADEPEATAER